MADEKNWTPRGKQEQGMHWRYRGWSPSRRMQTAFEKVLEQGLTQAEAARIYGISRSHLNKKLAAHRDELKQREERSAEAAARRREHRPVVPVTDETDVPSVTASEPDLSSELPGRGSLDCQPAIPSPGPLGIKEGRRIPPIGEFVRRYFDGFKCFDCGVHHEVPAFHDEMMEFAKDPTIKRGLMLVPPGHSKSTCVTVWCTVHDLYEDPNAMISIISAGGDLAEAFVYQIANLLTDVRLYEDCSGNPIDELGALRQPGSGWSQKGFYVGRISPEKDPSVRAYGWGSKIYGRRQHKIILDDLADVDNQSNPDQVEKMRRKIVREYDSRVGDNGKLIAVGTRIHPDDIYSHLMPLKDYHIYKRSCIVDEHLGLTLWPDHFGIDAANRARGRMTPAEFELIYQNAEVPTTEAIFTEDQLKRCHDDSRSLGMVPPGCVTFIGIDPAGAGEQAGYTSMICLAVDPRVGVRYLVDIVNQKQMRAYQMKDQIFEWVAMYKPREIIVEANGLQSQLVQYNQELLVPLAEKGVRVTGHLTHGGRGRGGKHDPEFGVQAMAPLFHNAVVNLPYQDINTRRKVGELEHQLVRFPHGLVTDMVMAFWIAETGVKMFQQTQLIEPFDARGTSRWPKRITRRRQIWDPSEGTLRAATHEEQRGLPVVDMEERRLVNVNRSVMAPRGA
jgi:hypothetical protein